MIDVRPADGDRNHLTVSADSGESLEELPTQKVIDDFRRHGAILFRGFEYDLPSLSRFTARYCSRFVRNESGRRHRVSTDGTTQTVNLGREAFALHPEMSRVPWRPDIAWFACVRAPREGGETLICDGAAVAEGLSGRTRALLAQRQVMYREETPLSAFTDWLGIPPPDDDALALINADSPFVFERQGEQIFRRFCRPFLHRPLFDDRLVFGNFLLFARFMLNTRAFPTFEDGSVIPDEIVEQIKLVSDRLTVAHGWHPGDLLMLDNSRFLHGRNPVPEPAQREIWTQFGFAGFLQDDDPRIAEPWRYTDDALAIFFGPRALELRDRRAAQERACRTPPGNAPQSSR
jgi:alpha-ketoglutarate-dependent taurine dioxygenase